MNGGHGSQKNHDPLSAKFFSKNHLEVLNIQVLKKISL